MVIKDKENSIGAWAFLIGVILAVIIGIGTKLIPIPALVAMSAKIYGVLVLLGIVVGLYMPVTDNKNSQAFLLSGAILVIVSKFGMDSVTGSLIGIGLVDTVSSTFGALLALFVPATIIVAVKTVFAISKI